MKNYYQILGISQTATVDEIQIAIDERYNKLRRQVSSHDLEIAASAQAEAAQMETIRSILIDPEKKRTYDNSLDVSGGLADFSAAPELTSIQSMEPKSRGTSYTSPVSPNKNQKSKWACPNCNTDNPNERFCFNCGGEVGQLCPNSECNRLCPPGATFCTRCGTNIEQYRQKRIIEEETRQLEQLNLRFSNESKALVEMQGWANIQRTINFHQAKNKLDMPMGWGCLSTIKGLLVYLVIASFGIVFIIGIADPSRIQTFIPSLSLFVALVIGIHLVQRTIVRNVARKRVQIHEENIASLNQKINQIKNKSVS